MKTKLEESSVLGDLGPTLRSNGIDILDSSCRYIYDSLIITMAHILSLYKDKNKGPNAVVIKDSAGNFLFGAKAEYHAPAEEGMPGSWSMIMTFDATDIEDCKEENIIDNSNPNFYIQLNSISMDLHKIQWKNESNVDFFAIIHAINSLKKALDVNVDSVTGSGEPYEIEMEGYFTASAVVEDGEKIFSIVPSGSITRIIKDDSGESVKDLINDNKTE